MRNRVKKSGKKALSFLLALSMLLTSFPALFGAIAAQTNFDIKEEDSPVHHKSIVDNGDGTFDINLDVHGYESKRVNVAMVIDVSGSMEKSISGQESISREEILFDSVRAFADQLYGGHATDGVEVNVSVVAFAGTAKILQTWTDTKDGVVNAINEAQSIAVSGYFPSGTNPQSGLELADVLYSMDEVTAQVIGTSEMATVSTNRPANLDTAENYVLLFSDGGPNRCYVNRDQIAITYEGGQAPAEGQMSYVQDNSMVVLTDIVYVDGVQSALYNGATYPIVTVDGKTGFTDGSGVWHDFKKASDYDKYGTRINYPGTDGYASSDEFYNDYSQYDAGNLTEAVLSSAPVMINRELNGDVKIATPDWNFEDEIMHEVVNIVPPQSTDYRKIAAQAALVEVEDIYEYAQSRNITIDVMTFGVGGWFTDNERDSGFPTAQRFLDLVAAVGNGKLSAYEAEEAYLLDDVKTNEMPSANADIDVADYAKVYASSNTDDAYLITDRNYNDQAHPWVAEHSATADVADWTYLDLGGLYAINRVEVDWSRIPGDIELKIALINPADTSTWTGGDASTSSNWIPVATETRNDYNNSVFTFDVRAVRYVMIYSPSRADGNADAGYDFAIDNIHVRQETSNENNVDKYFDANTSFALNKTVMVPWNATTGYEASDETTTVMTDGNLETVYSMTETSVSSVRDGVAIDLVNARNVNKIVIHWQYAPTSFAIETSYGDFATNTGYKQRANVVTSEIMQYDSAEGSQTNLTGTTTIEFDICKARYIGIKSENRNLVDGVAKWAIKEIEVYSTEKESDAFGLPPKYNIHGIGIAPIDSVSTDANGVMTVAPYYFINDAYDANRVYTASARTLNSDISFDSAAVAASIEKTSFGGDSEENFIEDFKKLTGTVLEGFARVHIYDTFSKYITLAHEMTGAEQKAGITSIDASTTTWTNPTWLTVKSYTSSNNEDGKNTSDTLADYVLDEVQIDKNIYTTYYHKIDDPNGGEMPTEVVELRFADEYILDNQSKVVLTVTVKPSQYAIDTLYGNISAADYIARRASYSAETGYSTVNPNGTINDNGIDPLATTYDRRATNGYPDQAFNVVFATDATTEHTLYNTANPHYADNDTVISAQIAQRQYIEGDYGFHTNVLAATNLEYYITAINGINSDYANNVMAASYDMPVYRPKLLNIPVRKVWNDGNRDHGQDTIFATITWQQNVWETSYDARGVASVFKAGTETKSITVELNEDNGWRGTFENVPQGYTYTVTEVYKDTTPVDSYNISIDKTYNVSTEEISVDGHSFSITDTDITDAQLGDGLVIINTSTVGKTVTKLWQGDDEATRPMDVTIRLLADGVAYGEDVVLNAANNWSYTWTEVEEYSKDGVLIDYHVVEVDMNGYAQYESNDYGLLTRYGPWDYYMSDTADVDENWYAEDYAATNTVWTNDGTNIFSSWYGATPNWTTSHIYLRRNFEIADVSAIEGYDLYLDIWYDQPFEVYINGTRALDYQPDVAMLNGRLKLPAEAISLLKNGTNLIAIHANHELNTDNSGSIIQAGLIANKTVEVAADTDYQIKTMTSKEIFPAGSQWLYYSSSLDDAIPNWAHAEFDSIGWPVANAPFGNTEGFATEVNGDYLWLRKSFTVETNEDLAALREANLCLRGELNENADIYINGRHVHSHLDATTGTTLIPLGSDASQYLVLGTANVIAIKIVNADGATDGVYFDAQLVAITDSTHTTNPVITNVYQSSTKEFSVVSTWDDQNNVDGLRPTYVTVQLHKNGVAEGDIVVLCPDDGWSYTWTDLEIDAEYTVVQSTLDGYTTTYDYSVGNLAIITNVHIPETVDRVVTKIWNDEDNQDALRPEEIKVQLYANGKGYGNPVTISGVGNVWNYTWTGLPKYELGREIFWNVQELDIPYGYAATYSDDRWTITNSHTAGVTSRTITKLWEDNNSATRPSEVTVQLYANAAPMPNYQSALVSTASNWYSIISETELYHEGWNNVGFGNIGYGQYQAPFGDLGTQNSEWTYGDLDLNGIDDSYYLYLRQEFNIAGQALLDEIKATDLILRTFYDQDPIFYINGQQVYSTTGFTTGYTDIILDEAAKNALQVGTNCIAIRVDNAGGTDGRFIDAGLYFSRSFTATLNAENNWTHTWDRLPLKSNGLAIKYAIYETNIPEGYSASYTTDKYDTTKLNVINTLTRDITVTKTWVDDNNALGNRPSSIDVQLFANGELYGESVTITDDGNGNWTYTWTDVPYYANGEEVHFSVSEIAPDGYVPYYGGTEENLTIQNYTNDSLENYSVKKTWDDMNDVNKLRPEYISVQLYQGYDESFTAYGRPVRLSASNNWSYTWEDLLHQIVIDGNTVDITYYVEEIVVPDSYTVSYSHSIGEAFTEIINTMHIQSVVLQKKDGFDPEIFLPGAEFKLELLADDKITVDTNFAARKGVTDNEGLLVFENLTVGYYLLTETKAPAGYDLVEPIVIEIKLAAQNIAAGTNAYVADESANVTSSNKAITDNDPTTKWTSASMTDSFYLDFGVDRAINKIDIHFENAPINMTVEYLAAEGNPEDANAQWRTLGTYAVYNSNGHTGSLIPDEGENQNAWGTGHMVVEFDTVVARYIRVSGDEAPINPFDNTQTKYNAYQVKDAQVFLDKTYEYAKDGFAYTSSVFTQPDKEGDIFQYTYMDMASNVGDSLTHRDDNNNDDGMYYGIKEEDYTSLDLDPDTEGLQKPEEWIAVDLLENITIDKLRIEWENASNNFRIIYLEDGCAEGDWLDLSKYTVYTGSSRTTQIDDNGNEVDMVTHTSDNYHFTQADVKVTDAWWYIGESIIYLDTPINARYIGLVSTERLCTVVGTVRDTYYAIREIDMYNTASENPEFDHALSKSAFAYNIRQRKEFLGTSAIDHDASNYLETMWVSDFDVEEQMSSVGTEEGVEGGDTQYQKSYRVNDYKEWFNVKLDGTVGINHIVLEWADSNTELDWGGGVPLPWNTNKTTVTLTYPEEYYILYSLDGSYWTEFYHVTDGNGGRDEYTFPEIKAKYVRVYIPDGVRNAGAGSAYALYSLELYSTADQYVVVTDTPQTKNSEVVIDYGLPVDVDVMIDQLQSVQNKASFVGIGAYDSSIEYNSGTYDSGIDGTEVVGKYGTLTVVNGKLRYTPTTMCFEDEDVFTYCLRVAKDDGSFDYKYSTLTVMPATSVQYEEDFGTITYSDGSAVNSGVHYAADQNLASGKLGYSLGEQGTTNMTDGSTDTKHGSGVTYVEGTPEFFSVDLGENTVVNKMTIAFENCPEEFCIAYLSDKGDPTDITAYSRLTTKYTSSDISLSDTTWGRGTITINFEKAINARYVGIYITDRYYGNAYGNKKDYLKVSEMELYNTTAGTQGLWTEVTDGTTGHKSVQDTDRPGKGNPDDADNAYGFDSAYDASAQFGLGNARKVTVSAVNNPYTNEGASWPTATFTFTGTGFDIIALTSNTTGSIWVDVYKGRTVSGSMYRSWLVDTYYGYTYSAEDDAWGINPDALSSLYQIPVINGKDFEYGTYTVVVTAAYSKGFDHTGLSQYDFYFDGVRVYSPAGSSDIQLGKTITQAYIADNEYNPNVTEIKTNLVDLGDLTANGQATGATFVDGRNSYDTSTAEGLAAAMNDFAKCGPNNEIYLSYGQGVAFNIYSQYEPTGVQIGFKSITGDEVTATVKFGRFHIADYTMSASTTRYFDTSVFVGWGGTAPVDFSYDEAIGMYKSNAAIVISNTMDSGGILSVTNIKLTYSDQAGVINDLVKGQTAYTLSAHKSANAKVNAFIASDYDTVQNGYDIVREQVLADKYSFVPDGFKAQWNEDSAKVGEKVMLTVTTSADVKELTVNGIDAAVKYYNAEGDEKASSVGAKKAVWTVTLDVDYAGEYLAQIEAVAESGKIYKTSATINSVE